ncbi:hypothetical protein CFIO01_05068 [Colletotrichum fioriniae PJ7]|uniref:Uncharacterized protein n=1 Tax=Colletotrichum fioriniae PJ7 TaxID=1445577 RepID=A0A010RG42_9PEZI|nr:hypothetical protein CFIO01_05068 [Colletotrichum fioriniae PJ7]
MASSDFNTQVLADQPSKKLKECDEVFNSIVSHPGEIPYHLARTIVDHLWIDFRNWISRLLQKKCDRPEPLSGLIAIDRRISRGGEREKAIFVHDLEVLCHYLQKTILTEGAANRLRSDKATRKDPLPKNSTIEVDYNIRLGPRSDLGWYMFFGIPMRILLLESASVMFSEKNDEAADAYLSEIVGKNGIEGRLINQHIH